MVGEVIGGRGRRTGEGGRRGRWLKPGSGLMGSTDVRSGASVRHPSEVVVGVDGLGSTPGGLMHSIDLGIGTKYLNGRILKVW